MLQPVPHGCCHKDGSLAAPACLPAGLSDCPPQMETPELQGWAHSSHSSLLLQGHALQSWGKGHNPPHPRGQPSCWGRAVGCHQAMSSSCCRGHMEPGLVGGVREGLAGRIPGFSSQLCCRPWELGQVTSLRASASLERWGGQASEPGWGPWEGQQS